MPLKGLIMDAGDRHTAQPAQEQRANSTMGDDSDVSGSLFHPDPFHGRKNPLLRIGW